MNVPLAHVLKAWSSAAGAILGGWQELEGPSYRRQVIGDGSLRAYFLPSPFLFRFVIVKCCGNSFSQDPLGYQFTGAWSEAQFAQTGSTLAPFPFPLGWWSEFCLQLPAATEQRNAAVSL